MLLVNVSVKPHLWVNKNGVSFCLQDRLLSCSDYTEVYVCTICGSILTPIKSENPTGGKRSQVTCRICQTHTGINYVAIPYVFKYLCAELAAMNVKLKLRVLNKLLFNLLVVGFKFF